MDKDWISDLGAYLITASTRADSAIPLDRGGVEIADPEALYGASMPTNWSKGNPRSGWHLLASQSHVLLWLFHTPENHSVGARA